MNVTCTMCDLKKPEDDMAIIKNKKRDFCKECARAKQNQSRHKRVNIQKRQRLESCYKILNRDRTLDFTFTQFEDKVNDMGTIYCDATNTKLFLNSDSIKKMVKFIPIEEQDSISLDNVVPVCELVFRLTKIVKYQDILDAVK